MTAVTGQRAVKTSAWLLYTLIVLEILFMVSPFAACHTSPTRKAGSPTAWY